MEAKEELQLYKNAIMNVRDAIVNLKKYKGNTYYRNQLEDSIAEFNRSHLFFKTKILKTEKDELIEKFKTVDEAAICIIKGVNNDEKLRRISELDRFWPELEIEFENLKFNLRSFNIPEEIPMTEYRIDLEEAIKNFNNKCWVSALVLCRRAYEGSLVSLYRLKTGQDPIEDIQCKSCKNIIRKNSYMGIAKLHNWAIENHLITDRMKQVGFLLSDLGSGAAHPPLSAFPRDPELARVGITVTIALLKELYYNS